MGRRGRRRKQLLGDFEEMRKYWKFRSESTKSHSVENSLWNRLWTRRSADCVTMMYITNVSSFIHLVQIAYERCPTGTGSLCTLLLLMTSVQLTRAHNPRLTGLHGICSGASRDCSHSLSRGTVRIARKWLTASIAFANADRRGPTLQLSC
jgi:hypothetical protein